MDPFWGGFVWGIVALLLFEIALVVFAAVAYSKTAGSNHAGRETDAEIP